MSVFGLTHGLLDSSLLRVVEKNFQRVWGKQKARTIEINVEYKYSSEWLFLTQYEINNPLPQQKFLSVKGERFETENNFGGVEYRERAFKKAYTPFDVKEKRDQSWLHRRSFPRIHRDLVNESKKGQAVKGVFFLWFWKNNTTSLKKGRGITSSKVWCIVKYVAWTECSFFRQYSPQVKVQTSMSSMIGTWSKSSYPQTKRLRKKANSLKSFEANH